MFANPCPGGTLSSGFGYRDFDGAFHKGIDLAVTQERQPMPLQMVLL